MPDVRLAPREECFGYKGGGCAVLSEALCVTCGRCAFFKTRKQARADTERARVLAAARGYYATGEKYTPRDWGQEGCR